MTIAAKYENGIFRPLEEVQLEEGTRVEVSVPSRVMHSGLASVRDWPIFGIWSGREDIPDGVTYEDRLRRPRY